MKGFIVNFKKPIILLLLLLLNAFGFYLTYRYFNNTSKNEQELTKSKFETAQVSQKIESGNSLLNFGFNLLQFLRQK